MIHVALLRARLRTNGLTCLRHYSARRFAEGDILILRPKQSHDPDGRLTHPLSPSKTVYTHKGTIDHASLIGLHPRDTVKTSKGAEYRVHEPTLAEYVRLSRRLVTPIYPTDANLIVSLLDLHPLALGADEKLEILEAGTGHGALTLHLARAIAPANTAPPPLSPSDTNPSAQTPPTTEEKEKESEQRQQQQEPPAPSPLQTWKPTRRAILHTLDISRTHSHHAATTIHQYKHSLYTPHIDFHTTPLTTFLRARPARSLAHILLDLPAAETQLARASAALQTDGRLLVFSPSVTQIAACVEMVRSALLPLLAESVLELGPGVSGGRRWDVRAVRTRVAERMENGGWAERGGGGGSEEEEEVVVVDGQDEGGEGGKEGDTSDDGYKMVCRPKVGERTTGGGFLGVWRKMKEVEK